MFTVYSSDAWPRALALCVCIQLGFSPPVRLHFSSSLSICIKLQISLFFPPSVSLLLPPTHLLVCVQFHFSLSMQPRTFLTRRIRLRIFPSALPWHCLSTSVSSSSPLSLFFSAASPFPLRCLSPFVSTDRFAFLRGPAP